MTLTPHHPPHPAERVRAVSFSEVALPEFTSTAVPPAGPIVAPAPAAPPAGCAHWLAYDPSSRSLYPID